MVFWLDAVRMSPGRIASALTMFSHEAMMKWVSTPSGRSWLGLRLGLGLGLGWGVTLANLGERRLERSPFG